MIFLRYLFFLFLLPITVFKTVGSKATVMYDGPTILAKKQFIAPAGMPVEVVHTQGSWSKIRDVSGEMSWVHTKSLSEEKSVVIKSDKAKIFSEKDIWSPLIFTADKGVLLSVIENAGDGWVKVKHDDGSIGFVRATDVWGI